MGLSHLGVGEMAVRKLSAGNKYYKYCDVNYEQLKSEARKKKLECEAKLQHVEKIHQAHNLHKEQVLLTSHQFHWKEKQTHLEHTAIQLQSDLQQQLRDDIIILAPNESQNSPVDVEAELSTAFDVHIVQNTCKLREALKEWVREVKLENISQEQLLSRKELLLLAIGKMHQLWTDSMLLLNDELKNLKENIGHGEEAIIGGIPEEAFNLECPNENLKKEILHEFILTDEQFKEKLAALNSKHADVLSENGSWCKEDHDKFMLALDIYGSKDMSNKRAYYFDMMKRILPHKSYVDLVDHETWWFAQKHYINAQTALISSWHRTRDDLLQKTKAVFAEACVAYEQDRQLWEDKGRQKVKCQELHKKVCFWKKKKMEILQLEQELEAIANQEAEFRKKQADEQKAKIAAIKKERVQKFKAGRQELLVEKQKTQAAKLKELHTEHTLQAAHNRTRIAFREKLLAERFKEKQVQKEIKLWQEQELQKQLDLIRLQVRITADKDPVRVRSATVASTARTVMDDTSCEVDLQKPLFRVHSYTSQEISADPRVRFEAKLREQNLLHSEYGRLLLKNMKPLHLPRPDQMSTFTFSEQ